MLQPCRQQGNGTDCGVYAMANIRSLLFGRDVNGEGMPGSHMEQKQGKGCYGASNEICKGVDVFEAV